MWIPVISTKGKFSGLEDDNIPIVSIVPILVFAPGNTKTRRISIANICHLPAYTINKYGEHYTIAVWIFLSSMGTESDLLLDFC